VGRQTDDVVLSSNVALLCRRVRSVHNEKLSDLAWWLRHTALCSLFVNAPSAVGGPDSSAKIDHVVSMFYDEPHLTKYVYCWFCCTVAVYSLIHQTGFVQFHRCSRYVHVAQLWQKDRARSAILSGWVTLRLNFRLKSYTFRANAYGPLDRGMVMLQPCRWKFSHKETL